MTDLNEQNRAINMRTVYLNASYFPAVEMLAAVGTAVILLYGGSQAIEGAIQVGVVVSFVAYLRPSSNRSRNSPSSTRPTSRGGGAGQDLRPARHRARHGRRAGRDRPRTLRGEIAMEGVWYFATRPS